MRGYWLDGVAFLPSELKGYYSELEVFTGRESSSRRAMAPCRIPVAVRALGREPHPFPLYWEETLRNLAKARGGALPERLIDHIITSARDELLGALSLSLFIHTRARPPSSQPPQQIEVGTHMSSPLQPSPSAPPAEVLTLEDMKWLEGTAHMDDEDRMRMPSQYRTAPIR